MFIVVVLQALAMDSYFDRLHVYRRLNRLV